MIQRVFAPSHIESVAIGQKRLSAQIFYYIRYGFSVIRPQIRQIPWFPKVNLIATYFFSKSMPPMPAFLISLASFFCKLEFSVVRISVK